MDSIQLKLIQEGVLPRLIKTKPANDGSIMELSPSESLIYSRFDREKGLLHMGGIARGDYKEVPERYGRLIWEIGNFIFECCEKPLRGIMTFDIINSQNAKLILNLMRKISHHKDLIIYWYSAADDFDMKELGEELGQLANIKVMTLVFPDNLYFTFHDFLRGYRLELMQ
jgi:hypothetical protein